MSHVAMEVIPQTVVLSESSISTAWHITKDPVKLQVILRLINPQIWKKSRIVVNHEK
jgi:hypothetical protein